MNDVKPMCCFPGCKQSATHTLMQDWGARMEDYTEACPDHVEMLRADNTTRITRLPDVPLAELDNENDS